MPVTTHFLPWHRPLPAQAAGWLAEGRAGKPIDLSDTWVIVPTRQAGRRLREAIARRAHAAGTAALAPRVTLPEGVFETNRSSNTASGAAVRLHWARTLLAAKASEVTELIPGIGDKRSFQWALGLAQRFARLRRLIVEGGLRFRDVTTCAGGGFAETERWNQLGRLETKYLERLYGSGLTDPEESKLVLARDPGVPPEGIDRIVLIGCPDPMPLALVVLEAWSRSVRIDVLVHAPASRTGGFDHWGRPIAGRWPDPGDDPRDFERCVHLCGDPAQQASRICAWAARYERPETMLAIGAADSAVVPFISSALTESGIVNFDPEGQPLDRAGMAKLIVLIHGLASEDSFENAGALARRPEILDWLGTKLGNRFAPSRFLAGLDKLQAWNLPTSLGFAIEHSISFEKESPGLGDGLRLLAGLGAEAREARFPEGILRLLAELLAHSGLAKGAIEEAQEIRDIIDEVESAAGGGQLEPEEGWELTLSALSRGRVTGEKPAGALEILGWLELLWEDAPHVVITGLNEGRVPESVTADAFLPGSLRDQLGLRTNADRLARDGYILSAIRAARGKEGRLDVLLARHDAKGDPLHPSRLLLACDEGKLPDRVRFLFRSPPPYSGTIPWSRAWQLRLPRPEPIVRIGVTAFRDYLQCPFRFFLKHGLGMEAVEPEKRELDVLDFGTLVHSVLEQLGRRDEWRDCKNGARLAGLFAEELDRIAFGRFGRSPSLPLVIQLESARQRLHQAAFVQAAERAEGWRIEAVEWKFPDDAVVFDGLVVRGKIDRIERHESTGVVRVIDYKTSDRPKAPAEAHRAKLGRGKSPRLEAAACEVAGSPGEWTDLQLPLYRMAAARFGEVIECGYFNLPKAVSETAIEIWSDLDDAVQGAAMACAGEVASRVTAGVFWPPNEDVREDEFSRLFQEGVAASIDPATAPIGGGR